MLKLIIRMLSGILAAYLVGLYVFLLVFNLNLISHLGDLLKWPLVAWMMLPLGFLLSVPFVVPLAIPFALLIRMRHRRTIFLFVAAGAICGACAVSLMQFVFRHALFDGSEFLRALGAAIIGGVAAGWVYGLYSRSKFGAALSQKS